MTESTSSIGSSHSSTSECRSTTEALRFDDIQRIPSFRGLIPLHDHRLRPYRSLTLNRWLHLTRSVFKAQKADLLCHGHALWPSELADLAEQLDLKLSWRTDCMTPPPDLTKWRALGLYDVFLAPADVNAPHFGAWLDACHGAGLPIRVQFMVPFVGLENEKQTVDAFVRAGVRVVNLSLYDPFLHQQATTSKAGSQEQLSRANSLVRNLDTAGIEANLQWLPFCLVDQANWPNVENSRQFYLDHQQYMRPSLELARKLFRRRPFLAEKVVSMLLLRHTLHRNPIDDRLLPWLLESPWLNARMAAWRRLTRHLRFFRSVPKQVADDTASQEREIARLAEVEREEAGPVCSLCSLRRICDRDTVHLRQTLRDVALSAQPGDIIVSPLHFAARQIKYYDAIDTARLQVPKRQVELAEEAARFVLNVAPDRLLTSADYGVDGAHYERMEDNVRWFSVSNSEKLSTPLGRLSPPFTLSFMVAGGLADYVGFSIGRCGRIVCPMELHRHEITLHVGNDGHFVFLRDGRPVRPVEFEEYLHVPVILGGLVEPRISLWNINGSLLTQAVRLWQGGQSTSPAVSSIRYSIVIVCTRYSRRLQATLRSIAHQEGIERNRVEVIVGYVPGLDATDDLLDSMQSTFPDLRILRSPFPAHRSNAKGFMINESAAMASGEWIILLDADILLPPNLLESMEAEGKDARFVFPNGRKMLSRETTAKVLLGEIQPWLQWQELLDSPGEHRQNEAQGIPIGYFQAVRAECFREVRYNEVEHFEWADWQFGVDMRARFGMEKRLPFPVAHLDHGGSRWYGTQQQF